MNLDSARALPNEGWGRDDERCGIAVLFEDCVVYWMNQTLENCLQTDRETWTDASEVVGSGISQGNVARSNPQQSAPQLHSRIAGSVVSDEEPSVAYFRIQCAACSDVRRRGDPILKSGCGVELTQRLQHAVVRLGQQLMPKEGGQVQVRSWGMVLYETPGLPGRNNAAARTDSPERSPQTGTRRARLPTTSSSPSVCSISESDFRAPGDKSRRHHFVPFQRWVSDGFFFEPDLQRLQQSLEIIGNRFPLLVGDFFIGLAE